MKNNKAFTLIELLAVIVILAIIALIATPIVLNIIKDSKENTIKISAENYLSALDNSIALNKEKIKNNTYDIIDKGNICLEYDSTSCINELKLKVEGTIPESGTITIEKGIVVSYELVYREKIIKKEFDGKQTIEDNPYKEVMDNNPGIICGDLKEKEDLNLEVCHIRSIEDLVAFSDLVSNGNNFSGKTVELVNSLDFKSINSYFNKKVDISLTTGLGFSKIGKTDKPFSGVFEGNNNTIKNLYINNPEEDNIAFFMNVSSAEIQNLNIENFNIKGKNNVGGLISTIDSSVVTNIKGKNINVEGNDSVGGVISRTSDSTISKIQIDNITVNSSYRFVGGLIGRKNSGIVKMVKLSDIYVHSKDGYTGGLIGSNYGVLENCKVSGNVSSDGIYLGMISGFNHSNITSVVVKGNIYGETYVGGLIGSTRGPSDHDNVFISGIFLFGEIKAGPYSNRMFGNGSNFQSETLAFSGINYNGKLITSTDITSKLGKSLANMGKASQSEYEAIGFEFESTDTNECYWYFDDNDELDLKIK